MEKIELSYRFGPRDAKEGLRNLPRAKLVERLVYVILPLMVVLMAISSGIWSAFEIILLLILGCAIFFVVFYVFIFIGLSVLGRILYKKTFSDLSKKIRITYHLGDDYFTAGKENLKIPIDNNLKLVTTKRNHLLYFGKMMKAKVLIIPKEYEGDKRYQEQVVIFIDEVKKQLAA
ncbi:hypothetical protein ACFVAD_16765 [Sutcliffiella sp. NPDC057660]|uniref:hypothetical protein n=1 Tax=Sutcliffiella sp. NPDC057660 TaxID=3346199 RepID=UPI0036B3CAF9